MMKMSARAREISAAVYAGNPTPAEALNVVLAILDEYQAAVEARLAKLEKDREPVLDSVTVKALISALEYAALGVEPDSAGQRLRQALAAEWTRSLPT